MNVVWSNKIDNILNKGIFLESIGVKNWALSEEDALNALDQFLSLQVPVLGGDVCELLDGVVRYNYDNWYCDRLTDESSAEFVSRSVRKAREYIKGYKKSENIFFAFVPGIMT